MKVKLDEVIEAICFSGMESEFYYDCRAEKVIMYFDGMIDGEVNKKLEEELFYDFGRFISLPSQYDIHKYSIMENFIFVLSDNRIQNYQLNAIRGRGAFRRFNHAIIYF